MAPAPKPLAPGTNSELFLAAILEELTVVRQLLQAQTQPAPPPAPPAEEPTTGTMQLREPGRGKTRK